MTPAVSAVLRGSLLKDPRRLPGIEAWYDVSDLSSLTYDSSNRVSLVADKSGRSNVNCLCAGGGTIGGAALTTGAALGTGGVTIVCRFLVPTANSDYYTLVGVSSSAVTHVVSRSLFLWMNGGVLQAGLIGTSVADERDIVRTGNLITSHGGRWVTATFVKDSAGATAKLYIDGVLQSSTESTTGTPPVWSDTVTSTNTLIGFFSAAHGLNTALAQARVYSAALDAAGVLADYNGTVQANIAVNVDFALAAKLATSFVCTTGQTVTINTSGATGARICGERDLYQGTVANQPVYLPWAGQNYGYLNGVSGNYFSATPPSVPTTQLEVAGRFDARVFATAATQNLGSQYGSPPGRSYLFLFLGASNVLRLVLSQDGTAETGVSSSATVPANTNAAKVNWRASDGRVQFFTSTDGGSNWSQLGADQTIAYASICTPTLPFQIGATHSAGTSNMLTGGCYWAYMASTIGGARISEFDASRYTSGSTFVASTGETWTLNGGAAIVTRSCLYFDGSNDYLKAAPFSLSQPETVQFVGSQVTWTLNDILFDGGSSDTMSVQTRTGSPEVRQYAGSFGGAQTDFGVGVFALLSGVYNGASSLLRINRKGGVAGSIGTAAPNGFTLGSAGSGSLAYANETASEIAIYSQAQSTSILDRFWSYAQRKWGLAP